MNLRVLLNAGILFFAVYVLTPAHATIFTLTDLTTSTVIDSSTQLSGHGHGHPHQATTECTGVVFNGAASDFFGAHLPPGVAPTDTVEASIDAFVIIKR